MEFYFYIIAGFILYVIAQSFVINGIKIASSGETETKPDGTKRDSPMILYPLAKFINQHRIVKVYYSGDELGKLAGELKEEFAGMIPEFDVRIISLELWDKDHMSVMRGIAKKLKGRGIFYEIQHKGILFYKEYKEYKFSKWLRMPTFGCIRCMSSFWSIGTYVYPMITLFGFHWWMIPLWFANIAAVTFVNTYIAQRYTE